MAFDNPAEWSAPLPEHKKKNFICPHCGVLSVHLLIGDPPNYPVVIHFQGKDGKQHSGRTERSHLVYRWVNCNSHTYFLYQGAAKEYLPGSGPAMLIAELPAKIIHQYPVATPVTHEAVPLGVMDAAIEAEKCLSVGAYNACGTMTRRAIDALCQDKKAEGKDLYKRLQHLQDTHAITPDLWEWAEELRVVGRSGAHPEWEEVSAEDAAYAVRFMREIIRYVYINPAERDSRRLKETKQKKPPKK